MKRRYRQENRRKINERAQALDPETRETDPDFTYLNAYHDAVDSAKAQQAAAQAVNAAQQHGAENAADARAKVSGVQKASAGAAEGGTYKTGDTSNRAASAMMAVLGGVSAAGLAVRKKKEI